ncbi:hypothetical protein CVIRNUC_010312 [Coccomyxa viridis]|uniref:Essential protein Yae1 N-terminal domain-containing protein n=1 Tax=Coccomyxa viridis TaxID=1274662 RepID=A0AAV1IID7_9CHLO|nr:hypothetical protein CVIRNUC_010312 [Coccomyxa viridis]
MCTSKEQANGGMHAEQDTQDPDMDQEWEARRARFYNVGYKEGLEEGKAKTLQQGFDEGFKRGAEQGYREGMERGHVATQEALAGLQSQAAQKEKQRQP